MKILLLLLDRRLQILDLAMFLQEFIEQHCVRRFVAHGVNFAVFVTHDQVRVHLGYFLGDENK